MTTLPRCHFAVRYPAGEGKWRYQPISIAGPGGGYTLDTAWVPQPGDLISLWDRSGDRPQPDGGPVFRVVDRLWSHASWGSANWPYGKNEPQEGPMVDIIVEPAEGPYRDETDICAESTCEAKWVNGAWWMPPGADEPDPHEHGPWVEGAVRDG